MFSGRCLKSFASLFSILLVSLVVSVFATAADVSIDDILAKAKLKFDSSTTFSVSIVAQMVEKTTRKSSKMGMSILSDKEAGLTRMTFTTPAAFKGQVIIVDEKAKTMKMYMPSTNQVMVSKLDKGTNAASPMGGMGMGGFNFTEGMSLPDKSTHDIKLLGKEKVGKIEAYIIQARDKKSPKAVPQKIWLAVSDLSPMKVELFDTDGKSLGTVEMKDFKYNIVIERKRITVLPADAEVIEG